MGKRLAKKVLLIGWDAADWKVINPLMDAGHMPTLERLVNGGVIGNLATLDPPLSPMLWTSIGTGKRPYKHGIHGFTEPDPSGKGIRPSFITSRKVKAVWNIFNQHGMKSHVVGWWPSHPAEPINGTMVSNLYQRATKPINEPWPMAPGTVHPAEKEEIFKKLRIHPGELTAAHILPFVPDAAKVDQEKDKRLQMLAKVLADASTVHAAATYIMENEEWDFMAVYHDAIDHFCHGFMKFHPPQLPGVPDDLYNLYKDVVISGYKFHDMMLERMLELAGDDVTVMLISDHGFHPDHLRPTSLPKEPAAPALEHSPYGIVVLNGPNIKKDDRIYGASILDVTPTLLTMYGLPVGNDMDGNVMVNAFTESVIPDRVDSWEGISGNSGEHPKDKQEDPYAAAEAMEQLVELGYIEKPDENAEKAIEKTVSENNYYLARAYINGRKHKEAVDILEKLVEKFPDVSRYSIRLAHCYNVLGETKKCREIMQRLEKESGKEYMATKLLESSLLIAEKKPEEAKALLENIEKDYPGARINMPVGRAYLQIKEWQKAEKVFRQEIEFDAENASAYHSLGVALLRQGKFEDAIDMLLNSVGLIYFNPFAHYHLGEALYGFGDYERAAEAFEVTLKMSPGINKARQWLAKLYKDHLDRPQEALQKEKDIEENIKGEIIVVSGLPRSGTSLMMQMLEKGGKEIFTDKKREADENNPKGYYEHELVKALSKNRAFLKDANGKVIKVISHLLFDLPPKYHYKVVFMERDLNEVLMSQHRMLVRDNKAKEETINLKLAIPFKQNIERVKAWGEKQPFVDILYVSHAKLMEGDQSEIGRINEFLGGQMDTKAMAGAIDKSLYREKSTQS
jgi:predicted AlkP superfamily phosphohydrolase/phosphomutase/tetratricopeptide (TPR) repeat protein